MGDPKFDLFDKESDAEFCYLFCVGLNSSC
jgi:hypothetical protein